MGEFFRSLFSGEDKISSNRFFGGIVLLYILVTNAIDSYSSGYMVPIPDALVNLMLIFMGGGAIGKAAEVGKTWAASPEPTKEEQH